ncbi:MAG: UDP-glucose--hexose-1-phosphate uridylyltransferase [Bryobacteraceae bacterium]|jgi:UDPglucose--hexose-1-phosphate uridylyltransferase
MLNWSRDPHRRYNPLTSEWVLVSPHRTERPWQGQVEPVARELQPVYDPDCYLCPGNPRAGGARNPHYTSTFVFENDFAALRLDTPLERFEERGLLVAETEPGICRVICFSPRHDLTVSRMDLPALREVVNTWTAQYQELGLNPSINYVEIFENRGAMMGCSNPHPHCQVWANRTLPNEPLKEQQSQAAYHGTKTSCLLCDYRALECAAGERVVCQNTSFVALVPFWAVWPFETLLLPKRHATALDELTATEPDDLADILKRLTTRYDNLFQASFPYTMGFHQRPTDGEAHPKWHLHAHFYPPLLRSATVRKFMVGYEMLAMPQRDITPETAAARLRDSSETHEVQSPE